MTVCFITNARHLGGAERVLLETIDVLTERGVQCRVILPGQGSLAFELARLGVPYSFLEGGSWVSWQKPSIWARIKAAIRAIGTIIIATYRIRKWKCDLIYSNTLTACNGSIVAQLLGVPHIWHLHEFGKEDHGVFYKFGETFSNSIIGPLSSVCIVVSNALAAKYAKYIAPSKLVVIYPSMHRAWNSYSASDSNSTQVPARGDRFRLVIVGGLVEGKGQTDAVKALPLLVQGGVNAELLIVGEGSREYRSSLESMVHSGGLVDRVRFTGNVSDAFPFLLSADVVLVCSRSEAFGRATIEGMLAGKPVIGAECGATPELIQEGFNGLLYKCDDPTDLALKVRFLSEHPSASRQFGENGKTWAAGQFTRERYAEQLMCILDSAVRPRHAMRETALN